MKKVFILVLSVLLLAGCNSKENKEKDNEPKENNYVSIMSYDDYKDINKDEIVSVKKTRYIEAGDVNEEITDKSSIDNLYDSLSKLKVGEKTERACEDNTTVYQFNMKNGKTYILEIECDWFVIGKNRFEIVK